MIDGWRWMILGLTCGMGVLLFLRLVADDLAASSHLLERFERRERREVRRRRAEQAQREQVDVADDDIPVLEAAGSIPG